MRVIIASIVIGFVGLCGATAQTLPGERVFGAAVEALDAGDYAAASEAVATADPLTRDLALWLQFREGEGELRDMVALLERRSDWPGLARIRSAAEERLDGTTTADQVIAFFDGQEPRTGQGVVAYAHALNSQGRAGEAEAMVVQSWRSLGLTEEGHQAILDAFPNQIAPHHTARADMLLWRWRTTDAAQLLPLLDDGQRALVRARIAQIENEGDRAEKLALVPARLRETPGLLYDQFNRYADRGDWTLAMGIVQRQSTSAERLGVPWRWGSWRRVLARWQMREGKADQAYDLAANHFIAPDESNYADLEWLSGYIALTYLNEPERALRHFDRFDAAVSSPISKGRAGYWRARAQEQMGDEDGAIVAYRAGAAHQTSFYGLLSAEALGLTLDPVLAGGRSYGDWRSSGLLSDEQVRAGLLLLSAGERGTAVLFFAAAAREMDEAEIGQLGQMLLDIDEPFYTVLVAKTAVRGGVWVQDAYFPLHPMAEMDLPVEPALALAIARQESEFRVDAGSSVGALGLMQLMPDTARDVAGWLDLPYSRGRLTSDWEYNATLGTEYLAYLTREFGQSPVMIAAGYNAGPSRPQAWMRDRGDPRAGFANASPVDVIDWIEHIPFRETRNYVMRVTEGIPVYLPC